MTSTRNIHVVPNPNGWAVQQEHGGRPLSVHATQAEAIASGRERARVDRVELVVHDRAGQISHRDSYGNDPYPPKG